MNQVVLVIFSIVSNVGAHQNKRRTSQLISFESVLPSIFVLVFLNIALEMYKFFKTKAIKRKMMKFCLSIPGDRSVSNFNKSASGESQNIMAEYVIES